MDGKEHTVCIDLLIGRCTQQLSSNYPATLEQLRCPICLMIVSQPLELGAAGNVGHWYALTVPSSGSWHTCALIFHSRINRKCGLGGEGGGTSFGKKCVCVLSMLGGVG